MAKNDKNKAFLMYDEYEEMFALLSPGEAMDIVMKMFGYFKRDEEPHDLTVGQRMFWALAKQHIDEDVQKYDEKVEKLRENAQKRYANASKSMQMHANAANKIKEKEIKEKEYSVLTEQNIPKTKTKAGSGLPSMEGRRPSAAIECPPEIAERFGGYKQTASYEREEALRKDGFFEMTALEKAEYLERKRNE